MADLSTLKPGTRVFDRHRNRERLIHSVEPLGQVVKLWFKDSHTGVLEPMTFPISEVERRFEVVESGTSAFRADSETVRLLAESYRLQHAYLFNPVFATETSLIDALPHQLIAVYDHMLKQPRLRFLLADDAGAGKTIMAGLYIREMLLRRMISRVLVVPPAGLVGNWEKSCATCSGCAFIFSKARTLNATIRSSIRATTWQSSAWTHSGVTGCASACSRLHPMIWLSLMRRTSSLLAATLMGR